MRRFLPSLVALLFPALLRADVVINEIMYHPASERTAEEYIELHNTGASSVNLEGWSFTSGVSFTFPNVSIPAGGYLVLAADRAAFLAKYPAVTPVVAGWKGRLSNSANALVLKNALGVKIDQVNYADDGDWAVRERDDVDDGHRGWRWRSGADGYGRSLELINAAFDNNYGQNWGASTKAEGTPGAANSIAAADIAPVVTGVRHSPLVPASGQTVTVNATIVDDRGAPVTASVSFRKGGTTWTTLPMFDDGAHNDGQAGDRIFGAQLPAQPDGTIVEFHVSATDGVHARTWPAPALNNARPGDPFVAEQSQNCLYQVDDSTAALAGGMPLYRLIMKTDDRTELNDINLGFGSNSHARFNATFLTVDGTSTEVRYLTGVRNRGHGSATRQPQSFNVAIPNDRDWNGRTALNLNSQYTDLQLLGSAFMRRAGFAASESRQVRLRVNNADPTGGGGAPSFGFYVCNEVQDSDFAAHHFPNDSSGNIYSVRRTDWSPYQEGNFAYLPPAGLNGGDPYRPVYSKNTNVSEDDWSDLVTLTQTLAKGRSSTLLAAPAWDADYVAAVLARIDVDQWMTWFAAQALVGNGETNLANGYGDDFSVYIGIVDPRARLIPYDLDTILGDGDDPASATADIFPMIRHGSGNVPALTPTPLYPLLRHPAFAPLYFAKLQQLLRGPLSLTQFNALADQILTGVVSAARIAERKAWYAARHAHVSNLVNPGLSVTSGPATDAATGYAKTTTASCALGGRTDPARTHTVKVNGVAATYVPWKVAATAAASNSYTVAIGEWTLADVVLAPGVNRVLVQAFDATGAEIERTHHQVWFDAGSVANASGAIATNTTWTAAGGPYRVAAPLTVNEGVTLTLEPGTTVYLAAGAGITVAAGGRILAEGTEAKPIHFTRAPGATSNGGTLTIHGAPGVPETRFRHVFFNFGGDPAVACKANSNVVLDYCEWLRTDVPYLHLDGGSFLVSNCIFPTAHPTAYFEAVHGNGSPPAGGRAIIRDCFFGKFHSRPGNYNDALDFTGGNRPGALFQLYHNVFIGSDDDLVDLDGTDAWIEGNIFMHVHRVGSPDSASAVSGGSDSGQTSEITVVGNLFFDVDQAMTAKEGNFFTFLNNTVVDQNSRGSEDRREDIAGRPDAFLPAVLNLGDDGIPGALGMYVEGNVIHSAEKLVRNYTGAELVTLNNNLLPPGLTWSGRGSGNTSEPALLADVVVDAATGVSNIPTPTKDNYRQVAAQIRRQFGLDARSPARGTGPNGTDKGGIRPSGVSLAGAPTGTTNATSAIITVGTLLTGSGIPASVGQFPGGSGWTHYRWRLDGGPWSAETPLSAPLALNGLGQGTHTLDVVGKNDAGTYQDSPDLGPHARLSSATWRVDPSYVPPAPAAIVRINEVLASNTATVSFGSVFPDLIELTNAGNAVADLSGWGLTDNAALPFKYTIPPGTTLAPGAHFVIYASGSSSVPAPRTGFALSASGDDLTLTRSAAAGGGIVDRVVWGQQLPDYSIGRSSNGTWALCRPTFGAPNILAAQSSAGAVKINEWLTAALPPANPFIELYNPGPLPVDIGGHFLTDNPVGWPNRSSLRPLTFLAAGGFLSLKTEGDAESPDRVNFRPSPLQGEIALVSPDLTLIDYVLYGPQRTDVAEGRAANGGSAFTVMLPTPGSPNRGPDYDTDRDGIPDAWEIEHGFDPNNPADAALDSDGDGQSNYAEYLAGTDPRNASDFIRTPRSNLPTVSRLANISVFATLDPGEVMTIGAAIGGAGTSGTKAIVVRAAGPALAQLGVTGVLPDPRIALIQQGSGASVAVNNDWGGDPALLTAFAQVGAFPYATANSKDAGIARPALNAANYTVQVSDDTGGSGLVIAELYDATPRTALSPTTPRLINVSVLKQIGAGATLTAGFVIDGSAPKTVLLRAVGPTLGLPPFNVPGAMADPKLALFDNATGAKLDENNDWAGSPLLVAGFNAVGAFALAHAATKDAALLVSLPPGRYSVQVSGADGGSGMAIVEIYDAP